MNHRNDSTGRSLMFRQEFDCATAGNSRQAQKSLHRRPPEWQDVPARATSILNSDSRNAKGEMLFRVLGLSSTAEVVYTALLDRPRADLQELVRATELTENEVRKALDDLADLAFLQPSREDPHRLRLISPHIALDLAIRKQEAELARRAQELAASRAAATEAALSYSTAAARTVTGSTEHLDDQFQGVCAALREV